MSEAFLAALIGGAISGLLTLITALIALRVRFERLESTNQENLKYLAKWQQEMTADMKEMQQWRYNFEGKFGAFQQFRDEWRLANAERLAMHQQNIDLINQQGDKLDKIGTRVAHIEGSIDGNSRRRPA